MYLPGLQALQYPCDAPPQPLRVVPLEHAWHGLHCVCPVWFWKESLAHASHFPDAAFLNVPTLHGRHTPSLAPPHPLRAAPATLQLSQAEQAPAPGEALYVPLKHASQCESAPVRGASAPPLPALPTAHESQPTCPVVSDWYLPSGQSVQLAALVVLLNLPAAHGSQRRSAVVFGATSTRSPFAQMACLMQKACPASRWKASAVHVEHSAASEVVDIVPAPHTAQRLGLGSL